MGTFTCPAGCMAAHTVSGEEMHQGGISPEIYASICAAVARLAPAPIEPPMSEEPRNPNYPFTLDMRRTPR